MIVPTWDDATPTWVPSNRVPGLRGSASHDFDVDDYDPGELLRLRGVLAVYLDGARTFVLAASVAHGWVEVPTLRNGRSHLDPHTGAIARTRKTGRVEIVLTHTGQVYR